jgi:hypothetical protein
VTKNLPLFVCFFVSTDLAIVHNVRHTDIKFPVALRHTPFLVLYKNKNKNNNNNNIIIIKIVGYTINKIKTDKNTALLLLLLLLMLFS